MDGRVKYLGAIAVLAVTSILLFTGFVDELDAEQSDGRSANQYGSATKGKVCGDKLCTETGGRTIMPWENVNDEADQSNCLSSEAPETCDELNNLEVEEATSEINQEIENTENSLDANATALNLLLPSDNPLVPVTIPLHQGYYMGKAIYYIITDSSDQTHADIITKNQGWEVNFAPLLANATKDALSKTYMFTNGVPGDGVHGFQGEVFTSIPSQTDAYSALTSHVHVTWNAGTIPRILDSEKELLIAVKLNQISLTPRNVVLNMPQIIWPEGQMPVKANQTLTNETPFVGGQLLDINLKNKTTTFIAHPGWDYEGRPIYFIVTDATPIGPAKSMGVTYAPKNAALISNSAAVDMFHFMNGITGSGPLGYQAGIASYSQVNATYSPMSRIYFIAWNNPNSAELLETMSDIDASKSEGRISINLARPMAADHIVNTPIVEPLPLNNTN